MVDPYSMSGLHQLFATSPEWVTTTSSASSSPWTLAQMQQAVLQIQQPAAQQYNTLGQTIEDAWKVTYRMGIQEEFPVKKSKKIASFGDYLRDKGVL